MLAGILICVVFVLFAALMMTRKLPTLFALPIMSILFAIIAGLPILGEEGIVPYVVVGGSTSLASSYVAILISCWLSQILFRTGVTNTIVKKAAELGGDKPFVIAVLLLAVSTFLFTVLLGTGAAAMVGAVAIPILIATGIPAGSAATLFLTSLGAGYCLNPANMASTLAIAGMTQEELNPAAIVLAAGCCVFMLVHLIVVFKKNGMKFAFSAPIQASDDAPEKSVKGIRGFLACLTPLVVVVLTLVLKWDAIATFLIGVVWAAVWTYKGKWSQYISMLVSSFNDGFKDGAPAAGLMFGIGMVLKAVSAPTTQAAILPFMSAITPKTVTALILMLCILAPLALYRGPLQIFGLGAGLLACIMGVGTFSPILLGALFYATSRWTFCACPTATQVVWASNFVGLDPATCTKKVQIPNWIVTIITIVIVALIYT